MRLFARLLIGNIAPVLVVTSALAFTLVALVRMTLLVQAVGDTELSNLREESAVHHACWKLDVALRHTERACVAQAMTPAMQVAMQAAASEVDLALSSNPRVPAQMLDVARSYKTLFAEIGKSDICRELLDRPRQQQRSMLDERLTDLWESRLDVLYAGVARKERRASQIGVVATWWGLLAAAGSILLALLLARRMARSVNVPLARLSVLTRQVGRGDFSAPVDVRGPAEIERLAADLEQMRCQLAKLEALKQGFLASVSHELRTPLSKIREGLALLSDGAVGTLQPLQARVVGIARSACEREIRLVTTLLDLSRMRTGSPLQLRDGCSIDEVIGAAIADERADATMRDVALVVSLQGEAPLCKLDVVLLERAIANLVRNAVAVSKRGDSVTITRYCERARQDGGWIKVAVQDEGPGVPDEVRATLFDAFVTSSVPHSPKAVGVGLGLALAKEVAVAHGGDLLLQEAATGAGKCAKSGAIFRLSIPVPQRPPKGCQPAQASAS